MLRILRNSKLFSVFVFRMADGETRRRGDKETGRQGDGGQGELRQGDGETRGVETRRWGDKGTSPTETNNILT
jgi:hypothetical protein